MQSANFNGSCKNDNFQLKYFVLRSYFCSGHKLWTHVRAKNKKTVYPC